MEDSVDISATLSTPFSLFPASPLKSPPRRRSLPHRARRDPDSAAMDASPLELASRQIRREVYRHLIPSAEIIEVSFQDEKPSLTQRPSRLSGSNPLALLTVCKKIGREAAKVLYGANTYVFSPMPFDSLPHQTPESQTAASSLPAHDPHVAPTSRSSNPCDTTLWHRDITAFFASIGSANLASLRHMQIGLGTWRLHTSSRALESEVAAGLGLISRLLSVHSGSKTHCSVRLCIDIPTPATARAPCVVDLRLSVTDLERAARMVDRLFDGGRAQLDRLREQQKISRSRYRLLETDLVTCCARLQGLLDRVGAARRSAVSLPVHVGAASSSAEQISRRKGGKHSHRLEVGSRSDNGAARGAAEVVHERGTGVGKGAVTDGSDKGGQGKEGHGCFDPRTASLPLLSGQLKRKRTKERILPLVETHTLDEEDYVDPMLVQCLTTPPGSDKFACHPCSPPWIVQSEPSPSSTSLTSEKEETSQDGDPMPSGAAEPSSAQSPIFVHDQGREEIWTAHVTDNLHDRWTKRVVFLRKSQSTDAALRPSHTDLHIYPNFMHTPRSLLSRSAKREQYMMIATHLPPSPPDGYPGKDDDDDDDDEDDEDIGEVEEIAALPSFPSSVPKFPAGPRSSATRSTISASTRPESDTSRSSVSKWTMSKSDGSRSLVSSGAARRNNALQSAKSTLRCPFANHSPQRAEKDDKAKAKARAKANIKLDTALATRKQSAINDLDIETSKPTSTPSPSYQLRTIRRAEYLNKALPERPKSSSSDKSTTAISPSGPQQQQPQQHKRGESKCDSPIQQPSRNDNGNEDDAILPAPPQPSVNKPSFSATFPTDLGTRPTNNSLARPASDAPTPSGPQQPNPPPRMEEEGRQNQTPADPLPAHHHHPKSKPPPCLEKNDGRETGRKTSGEQNGRIPTKGKGKGNAERQQQQQEKKKKKKKKTKKKLDPAAAAAAAADDNDNDNEDEDEASEATSGGRKKWTSLLFPPAAGTGTGTGDKKANKLPSSSSASTAGTKKQQTQRRKEALDRNAYAMGLIF